MGTIKKEELDRIREISNIGLGHAATSLSQLLDIPCTMTVPTVTAIGFDEMIALAGGSETEVAAITLKMEGAIRATMLLILPACHVSAMIRKLTGGQSVTMEGVGFSALREFGNIIAGAYVTTFADVTKLNVHSSIPDAVIDMAGAAITPSLLSLSLYGDEVILIQTDFNDWRDNRPERFQAQFYFLPEPGSINALRTALQGLPS
ncbi:CheY-P-specific phosphatase CheC [Salicibibacter halophilus]|uniref:CheY-P-specific phosphatase CheC n=1 Tax=Salicibibacter halophilus TaxID=2502791 RepID=A0A514LG93_9BACI|nr:chemotaxis protein CheC [Salicibibacter halophilus]QDI90281.1 CheY-P-specific phosphatase CheC [Salicibibacter halophilus]